LGPAERAEPVAAPQGNETIRRLAVVELRPNPYQPRHRFVPESLEELTASIQEKGILQPLIARKMQNDYEIVAGERRWRAAQRAGLSEVPVIVRDYNDQEMLELALIENLQRDDLNAVEEARSYKRLIEEFEVTQEQAAERVGKSRVAVTNALRLLRLPEKILEWIEEERITAGHARALLSLDSEPLQMALAREIMSHDLSVREAEKRVRRLLKKADPSPKAKRPNTNLQTEDLEEKLQLHLGLQVKILPRTNTTGKVEVYYDSLDEFQRLFDHLGITLEEQL
jgi:ParB family chromosome partitioning protein